MHENIMHMTVDNNFMYIAGEIFNPKVPRLLLFSKGADEYGEP